MPWGPVLLREVQREGETQGQNGAMSQARGGGSRTGGIKLEKSASKECDRSGEVEGALSGGNEGTGA